MDLWVGMATETAEAFTSGPLASHSHGTFLPYPSAQGLQENDLRSWAPMKFDKSLSRELAGSLAKSQALLVHNPGLQHTPASLFLFVPATPPTSQLQKQETHLNTAQNGPLEG